MEGNNNFLFFSNKIFLKFSKSNLIVKSDISKAYSSNGIDISERELNEMIKFMTGEEASDELMISKEDLKKFYIS